MVFVNQPHQVTTELLCEEDERSRIVRSRMELNLSSHPTNREIDASVKVIHIFDVGVGGGSTGEVITLNESPHPLLSRNPNSTAHLNSYGKASQTKALAAMNPKSTKLAKTQGHKPSGNG